MGRWSAWRRRSAPRSSRLKVVAHAGTRQLSCTREQSLSNKPRETAVARQAVIADDGAMTNRPAPSPLGVFQMDGAWWSLGGRTRQMRANCAAEVVQVLQAAERAADEGSHVVGFVAYEAAAAFGLACHTPAPDLPLAAFIVAERLEPFDPARLTAASVDARDLDWQPGISRDAYSASVVQVRRHLARGDSYQVNLTFPLSTEFEGDPFALFGRLARAQRSTCATYVDFGRFAICSSSPELFFTREGDEVTMRPMKGTADRGRTVAEDQRHRAALRRSVKERAENLMIVDMVRNDLGRIARVGTVAVPELFRVEQFPTVLQMTSTVVAETGVGLAELLAATFPCASVTGAPKVRTAELIHELEAGPRGVYTGAIGYIGPARRAQFAVAIRTATVDRELGTARYGVGSGIVWDSRPGREYAECLAKARVLHGAAAPFALLETMRWDPKEGFTLLERHLQRQASSARYFDVPYDRARVRSALDEAVGGTMPLRVRLLIGENGDCTVETAPLAGIGPGPMKVGFAASPVDVRDPFLFHKTTRRDVYMRARASRPDCEQVILWNGDGMVTETDIANLAIQRGGRWVTPPLSAGLLPGTMRAELLKRGEITEGAVSVTELGSAGRIAVFNSVRGWQEAEFVAAPLAEVRRTGGKALATR